MGTTVLMTTHSQAPVQEREDGHPGARLESSRAAHPAGSRLERVRPVEAIALTKGEAFALLELLAHVEHRLIRLGATTLGEEVHAAFRYFEARLFAM
jgi:hypothetical protein